MLAELRNFRTNRASLDWTLEEIVRLVREFELVPEIRGLAIAVARMCPPVDQRCQASTLLEWMRGRLRYVPDPQRAELLADPLVTLKWGGGDCDDLTTAFASLARAMSLRVALVVGATEPNAPEPTHILPAVWLDGRWEPAEVSSESIPFGVYAPHFQPMKLYPL